MGEAQPSVMQILFADHDFPDIDLEREIFGAAGLELKVAQCKREAEVVDAARGCAAILLQYAPIGAAVVEALPQLGLVSRIGAGFDTRAFRLPGGRWVELDEPAIIAVKETHLPASDAPNPLTRVAIAFGHDPLAAALTPFCDHLKPVVVLEGVFSYLSAAELRGLLDAIRATFANPTIVCDLTTLAFARRHGGKIGKQLRELGAPYGRLEVEPLEVFQAAGFRLTSRQSIVGRAVSLGLLRIPGWLLATVLRSLRDGYTIATFEPTPPLA